MKTVIVLSTSIACGVQADNGDMAPGFPFSMLGSDGTVTIEVVGDNDLGDDEISSIMSSLFGSKTSQGPVIELTSDELPNSMFSNFFGSPMLNQGPVVEGDLSSSTLSNLFGSSNLNEGPVIEVTSDESPSSAGLQGPGDLSSILSNLFGSSNPNQGMDIKMVEVPTYISPVCVDDSMQHCLNAVIDGEEHDIRLCMLENFSTLTPTCQNEMNENPTTMEACYPQMKQYCGVHPTCPETIKCLHEHQAEITSDPSAAKCLPFVNDLVTRMDDEGDVRNTVTSDSLSVSALSSSSSTTPPPKDDSSFFTSEWFFVLSGGMVATTIFGVIYIVKKRDGAAHRDYESVPSPGNDDYDEYA